MAFRDHDLRKADDSSHRRVHGKLEVPLKTALVKAVSLTPFIAVAVSSCQGTISHNLYSSGSKIEVY